MWPDNCSALIPGGIVMFGFRNLLGLLFFISNSSFATVYYVDSVGGNDAWSGKSSGQALKTLTKVNTLALVAGDSVFFRRGRTYIGGVNARSGSASAPVKYGAWGEGALPVISANQARATVINGADKSYVVVENLRLTQSTEIGILLQRSRSWKISNVIVSKVGGPLLRGAIQCGGKASSTDAFPACKDIRIEHVTVVDTKGDGLQPAKATSAFVTPSRPAPLPPMKCATTI